EALRDTPQSSSRRRSWIAGLFAARGKFSAVEGSTDSRLEFEGLIVELSRAFADVPTRNPSHHIAKALAPVLRFFSLDSCTVFELDSGAVAPRFAHSVTGGGLPSRCGVPAH